MSETMRALFYRRYGDPEDVLALEEIPVPVPGPGKVLVEVRACAFNPLDWHLMTGRPAFARLSFGPFGPRRNVPGNDVAGVVAAVGEGVTRFQPGDEVFGETSGGMAEMVSISEDNLVSKPSNATFEEAAGVPIAGLTALQGLRDWGGMNPGDDIIIVGASGGVGTYAVQIAKALGAGHVTAVSSTRNVETAHSLGADLVIDYTKQDYIDHGRIYDLVFDGPGARPLRESRRLLKQDGRYVLFGGPKGRWIKPLPTMAKNSLARLVGYADTAGGLAETNQADLIQLRDWLAAGTIRTVIDRVYKLEEGPEALMYQGTFHARGKIVITI